MKQGHPREMGLPDLVPSTRRQTGGVASRQDQLEQALVGDVLDDHAPVRCRFATVKQWIRKVRRRHTEPYYNRAGLIEVSVGTVAGGAVSIVKPVSVIDVRGNRRTRQCRIKEAAPYQYGCKPRFHDVLPKKNSLFL